MLSKKKSQYVPESEPQQKKLDDYTLLKKVKFDKSGVITNSSGKKAHWYGQVYLTNDSKHIIYLNETLWFDTPEEAWEFVDEFPQKFKEWCDSLNEKNKTIIIKDSF